VKIKVKMTPYLSDNDEKNQSGIKRVIESYTKYFPEYDLTIVPENSLDYDISSCHASATDKDVDVVHCHGLYWTADYNASSWEWDVNSYLVSVIKNAKVITVPSNWVAKAFQRDMRFSPIVVPHGIDYWEWEHTYEPQGYVLWNKNRTGDVCDPSPMQFLAEKYPNMMFVSTFSTKELPNIHKTGVVSHNEMKVILQQCEVYLSTTKETFGIGVLEAMASGVPVLGFAHGGNLETVKHLVNGYLAKPGDYEDLAVGLEYCIKYRKILGENGMEMVRNFTWGNAVQLVRKSYELALEKKTQDDTVGIIVPVYNKSKSLSRTLDSIVTQNLKPDKVVIVDDGSTDNSLEIAMEYSNKYGFVVIHQDNSGVAIARNNGIQACDTKYVCCLDADDAIKPDYLKMCIKFLTENPNIGIAYTALWYIKPDGSEGLSAWPSDKPSYDDQMKGQNQIPTCCVYKREMWERLGGYKQRYSPLGAGSEDAEFWLRAGSIGYSSAMATAEPLFVYSLGGGITSLGEYREIDWTEWQPYTKDGNHPFASVATPKKQSHAVRQYDEPLISVIIPVGKGHEELIIDAIDSVEAQNFRKWECIVVWDSPNEFRYKNSYPFVNFINVYDKNPKGAGFARNRGVDASNSDMLLFLDADDYLSPDALSAMLDAWQAHDGIIYTDYYGMADVDDVTALEPALRKRIINRVGTRTLILHKALEFDCELAQAQPQDGEPYLWANVTCLLPKKWHNDIGGFDEKMESWEDVDYHFRMARNGICYYRIEKPLLTYRFFSGHRRDDGLRNYSNLVNYMREKYSKMITKGCRSCGQSRVRPSPHVSVVNQDTIMSERNDMKMSDEDFVKCQYASRNTGQHKVVGAVTGTQYGYRAGGDVFLVHQRDIAVQKELFIPIDGGVRPPSDANSKATIDELPYPAVLRKTDYNAKSDLLALVKFDVPAKTVENLMIAGYLTIGDVDISRDKELLLIKGITKTKLAMIRGAIKMALGVID